LPLSGSCTKIKIWGDLRTMLNLNFGGQNNFIWG